MNILHHVLSENLSKSHNFKNLVFCDVTLYDSTAQSFCYFIFFPTYIFTDIIGMTKECRDNLQMTCKRRVVNQVASGVVNQIVKNVAQSKRRQRVEVVHGLQGKWIGNWHVMNSQFFSISGLIFSKFGSTGKSILSTAERISTSEGLKYPLTEAPRLMAFT